MPSGSPARGLAHGMWLTRALQNTVTSIPPLAKQPENGK
jgi:hypothetical protein